MIRRLKYIGPGAMVAAAFIGPGTVATATLAGTSFGYTLLWAITFSILSTIILQEMAGRLGTVAKIGLGEAIRLKIKNKTLFVLSATLVISAIFIGNSAYESGNISGAVLGFQGIVGEESVIVRILPMIIGLAAATLLFIGNYRIIEKSLVILVGIIGCVFLLSAILLQPDFSAVFSNMFIPAIPKGSGLLIVGLIGTTVVPYNLFLHASSTKEKWKSSTTPPKNSWDTILSILFGGLITMSILITAAAVLNETGETDITPKNLGAQLEPLLGSWSNTFLAFGFLAAGLSSAITAPLAASYAVSELMGWKDGLKNRSFRLVWLVVIGCGITFASIPTWKPASIILFAQVANGILLPVIVLFLLLTMNDKQLLGTAKNRLIHNILGGFVLIVTIVLATKGIGTAFHLF